MPVVVAAFVTPCVNDEKDENHEAENQEHHDARLVIPNLLKAFGNLGKIHLRHCTPS